MATSLDSPSPLQLNKEGASVTMASCSPLFSPSSDKCFWSNLRSKMDAILDYCHGGEASSTPSHTPKSEKSKRLKEGSLLLIRGFDSIAYTLSLLSNNVDNALQEARELGQPPPLTDIFQSKLNKVESKEDESEEKKTLFSFVMISEIENTISS